MQINKFLMIASLTVFFGAVEASELVKITNNANVPVAGVLVQTEKDTEHVRLYTGTSRMSEDARHALQENMKKTKAFVLNPRESTTMPNFPQKISEYDRAVWLVPLDTKNDKIEPYLQSLGISVTTGNKRDGVKAFEVGSAKTVQITGSADELEVNTTGKLLGAAKGLFKSSKATKTAGPTRGYSIREMTEGIATAPIKKHLQNWEDELAQSKKPAAKKTVKGKAVNYPNPEGWADNKGKNKDMQPSFNDAVKTLQLTPDEVQDLLRYRDLDPSEQESISKIIDVKYNRSKTKAAMYAKHSLTHYLMKQQ